MKKFILSTLLLVASYSSFAQWKQCPNQPFPPFGGMKVTGFLEVGNELWAAVGNAIITSGDAGETWNKIDQNQGLFTGISGISGMQKLGNKIFVSISGNGNTNVFSSTNAGQSWKLDTMGWPGIQVPGGSRLALTYMLNVNEKAVVGMLESNFTIYQLPGDTVWRTMSVPDAFRTTATFVKGDTLYKATSNKIIYTTDFGQNWGERNISPIPNTFYLTGFQSAADGNFYCAQVHTPSFKQQLLISRNHGHTWDTLNYRSTIGKDIYSIYADDQGILLSGPGQDTLLKSLSSKDGGQTWFDMSKGLSHIVQYHFQNFSWPVKHKGIYFAGYAEGGVFKSNNIIASIENTENLTIKNVWPNPTSNMFYIEGTEDVLNVEVMDISGKVLKSFANQDTYDISELSMGMYTLRIQSESGYSYRKIIKQ